MFTNRNRAELCRWKPQKGPISVKAPMERQQAVSEAERGVDLSGSIVLRSWRADDADVAHTVTDADWTVFYFPSGMDFAAIPSHQQKSASVKGSNALDIAHCGSESDRRSAHLPGSGLSGTSSAENAT